LNIKSHFSLLFKNKIFHKIKFMNFTFTGFTTSRTLWQSATIPTAKGSPPAPLPGVGDTVAYTPDDQPITWNPPSVGKIPNVLTSVTFNDLRNLDIKLSMTNRKIIFNMTGGIQTTENTGNPNINVSLWQTNPDGGRGQLFVTDLPTNNPIGNSDPDQADNYCNPNNNPPCPTFTYETENTATILNQVQAIPWNNCGNITICSNYEVTQFGMISQMFVTLNVSCMAQLGVLDSGFCLNYCLDNLSVCKQPYQDFCFAPIAGVPGTSANITGSTGIPGSTGCQTFFTDYYTAPGFGPEASIDDQINTYCSNKYTNIGFALFNTTPPSEFEKKLCACHMPQHFYDEYKDSIAIDFPNFINFIDHSSINERCLLSPCASSPFSSTDIKQGDKFKCQVPACIQVVEFNNSGSINGKVNIDQNNSTCVAINSGATGATGSNGNNGNNNKSWWDQHWLWVSLGIGLLVMLIIAILIILAVEGNKKPPKKKI
jgi:hypothetical protein